LKVSDRVSFRAASRRVTVAFGLLLGAWIAAAWALDRYGRGREPAGEWDAIIVAGAKVYGDGLPSPSLVRRTEKGAELWRAGRAPILVLTGGPYRKRPAEAAVAAEIARGLGVPASALRIEPKSRTTAENARFARELALGERVLVVTDAYHVYRTERLFRGQFGEVEVVGVVHAWHPQLRLAMREVGAVVWFLLGG
jgi:uncharacterized SAM-binding protein YcdF (DUF218 family)